VPHYYEFLVTMMVPTDATVLIQRETGPVRS